MNLFLNKNQQSSTLMISSTKIQTLSEFSYSIIIGFLAGLVAYLAAGFETGASFRSDSAFD